MTDDDNEDHRLEQLERRLRYSDGTKRILEWFPDVLEAAGRAIIDKDSTKGVSWRSCDMSYLYQSMMYHAKKMTARAMIHPDEIGDLTAHCIDVANYALMLASRLAKAREKAKK